MGDEQNRQQSPQLSERPPNQRKSSSSSGSGSDTKSAGSRRSRPSKKRSRHSRRASRWSSSSSSSSSRPASGHTSRSRKSNLLDRECQGLLDRETTGGKAPPSHSSADVLDTHKKPEESSIDYGSSHHKSAKAKKDPEAAASTAPPPMLGSGFNVPDPEILQVDRSKLVLSTETSELCDKYLGGAI